MSFREWGARAYRVDAPAFLTGEVIDNDDATMAAAQE